LLSLVQPLQLFLHSLFDSKMPEAKRRSEIWRRSARISWVRFRVSQSLFAEVIGNLHGEMLGFSNWQAVNRCWKFSLYRI